MMKCLWRLFLGIWKGLWWIVCHSIGWLFGWIPHMKKHMSGEEFENYVAEILKKCGYKHVRLTQKSGDYGVDILAVRKKTTYAFQCKFYSRPVGVSAIQQAYSGCEYYDCDEAVVVTNQTFTRQACELACRSGVTLWDAQMLRHMRSKANQRAVFSCFFHRKEKHPYEDILHYLISVDEVSSQDLHDHFSISVSKAYYILDDLQFYDIVSAEDEIGNRTIYIDSFQQGMQLLERGC